MTVPMISDGDGRMVEEWFGATPDSMPPPRVRLRIFRRYGGTCYLTGRAIRAGDKWDLDHIVAIINGGENRESNLAPALKGKDAHGAKTARDLAIKAKTDRIAKGHLGIRSARRKIPSRRFPKRARPRIEKLPLPTRRLI